MPKMKRISVEIPDEDLSEFKPVVDSFVRVMMNHGSDKALSLLGVMMAIAVEFERGGDTLQ